MEQAKHTPGPWMVRTIDGSLGTIDAANGATVAQAQELTAADRNAGHGERRANARLIAAAPDLLQALKLCAAVCAGETPNKSGLIFALEKARAALMKAQGEQQ